MLTLSDVSPIRMVADKAFSKKLIETLKSQTKAYDNTNVENVEICDDILKLIHASFDKYYFIFYFLTPNLPVGAMAISKASQHGGFWIECLVTHPGTQMGGLSLIEFAVNLSVSEGFGGSLVLGAAYPDAQKFYASAGFTATKKILTEQTESGPHQYPICVLKPKGQKHIWKDEKGKFTMWGMSDSANFLAKP
jgi:hypothetical protein